MRHEKNFFLTHVVICWAGMLSADLNASTGGYKFAHLLYFWQKIWPLFRAHSFWVLKMTSSRIQTDTDADLKHRINWALDHISWHCVDQSFRQMSWIFVTTLAAAGRSWQPGFSPPLILRMPSLPQPWVRDDFLPYLLCFLLLCSFCIRFSRWKHALRSVLLNMLGAVEVTIVVTKRLKIS